MAQTVFINVTVDPSPALDPENHRHTASHGTAASSDVTVSFDPTKVKTIGKLRSAVNEAVRQIAGGKTLTP